MLTILRLLLALPILTSCTTPFPTYELTTHRADTLSERFPDPPNGTRMTLRAILEYRGMELPMTFRIWRMLPNSCRIIVTDDLGGSLLHVVDHESEFTIISRAAALPEEFVRSLCYDLTSWLFARPHPDDQKVTFADGTPGILQFQIQNLAVYAVLQATKAGHPIDRIMNGSGTHLTSEIKLEWDDGRARNVEIENHLSGYTVDLEVREWQPAELTPAKFKTKR